MARAITIQFLGDVKNLVSATSTAESSVGGASAKFAKAGKVAAVGFAAMAGAAIGGGKALYEVGEIFDDVADTIRVGTGATGEDLDALVASAKRVGTEVPASFGDVGATIADLNTRLGLTGPALETLSKQFLEAGRITGEALDVESVTAAFNVFDVEGPKASKALDDMYRVSQATGVSMNELAASVERNGPNLKQFGFSVGDSAALIGTMDKAGLDSNKTLATLSRAMVSFAKDGREPQKALLETVSSIEEFTKSGEDAKAINLAAEIFGTRGASQFVAAIKSGKVNLQDLMGATGATGDTILKAGEDTADFAEQWQLFKNKALVAVEPVATRVFNLLGDGMAWLTTHAGPAFTRFGDKASAAFTRMRPTLQAWSAHLSTAFGWLRTNIPPVLAVVQGAFSAVVGWVQANLPTIRDTVSDVLGTVRGIFETTVTIVTALWDTFGGTLVSVLSSTLGNLVQILSGAFQIVRGIFKTISALLSGDWGKAWEGIKLILRGALNVIVGIVKSSLTLVKALFGLAWDAVKAVAAKAWEGIKDTVSAGLRKMLDAIKGIPGKIRDLAGLYKSAAKFVVEKLLDVFTGLPEDLARIGGQLIDGLVRGIKNAAHKVTDVVNGIVNKIPKRIRKIMGIASPSKVTTALGEYIGEGLAKGIASKQGKAEEAAKKLVERLKDRLQTLKDAFKSVRDSIAGAFTSDLFQAETASGFIANLTARKGQLGELKNAFKTLGKLGWKPQALASLFQSGNAGLILDLAKTPELAQQGAGLYNDVMGSATDLGAMVGDSMYGNQIDALQGKLKGARGKGGNARGGDMYQITINGALDPQRVGEQVEKVLRKRERETGRRLLAV